MFFHRSWRKAAYILAFNTRGVICIMWKYYLARYHKCAKRTSNSTIDTPGWTRSREFLFYSVATKNVSSNHVRRARENTRWPGLCGKYSKYEKSAENERWATERIIGARDRCRRSVFSRAIVFSFRARWSSRRRRSRFVLVECRGKYWCADCSIIRMRAMRIIFQNRNSK